MPLPDFDFLGTGVWGDEYRNAGGIVVPEYLQELQDQGPDPYGTYEEPPAPEPAPQQTYMDPAQFIDWPTYQGMVGDNLKPHEAYDKYVNSLMPSQLRQMGYSDEEITQAVQQFPRMVAPPAPDYGVAGNLWEAFTGGVRSGNRSEAATLALAGGDLDKLSRLVTEQATGSRPTAPEERYSALANDPAVKGMPWESLKTILSAIWEEPQGAAASFTGSMAGSYPALVGGAGGATAGGLIGGPAGIIPGAALGTFGGSASVEVGAQLLDRISAKAQERGVDVRDPQAVSALIADPVLYNELRNEALAKGITTGAFDGAVAALTLNLGKAAAAAGQAGRTGRAVGLGATGLGAETVGGMAGEAAGQAAAGDELDWRQIWPEGLLELGPGGAHLAGGAALQLRGGPSPLQGAQPPSNIEDMLAANNTEPETPAPIPTLTGGVVPTGLPPVLRVNTGGGVFNPTQENLDARLRGERPAEEINIGPADEEITIGDVPHEEITIGDSTGEITPATVEEITLQPAQLVDSAELRIRDGRLLPSLPPGRGAPPLVGGTPGVGTPGQFEDARLAYFATEQPVDLDTRLQNEENLLAWMADRGVTLNSVEQAAIVQDLIGTRPAERQAFIADAVDGLAASREAGAEPLAQALLAISRSIPKERTTRARTQAALESALPGIPPAQIPKIVASEAANKVMADMEAGVTNAPVAPIVTLESAALPARGPLPDAPVVGKRGLKRGESVPTAGGLGGLVGQITGVGPARSDAAPVQQPRGGLRAGVNQEGAGGRGRRGTLRGGQAVATGQDTGSAGAQPVGPAGAAGVQGELAPPIKVQFATTPAERRYGTQEEDTANKEALAAQREETKAKKATGGLSKKARAAAKEKAKGPPRNVMPPAQKIDLVMMTKEEYESTYPGRSFDADTAEILSAEPRGPDVAGAEDVGDLDEFRDASPTGAGEFLGPMSDAARGSMRTMNSAMRYIGATASSPLARIVADHVRALGLDVPFVFRNRTGSAGGFDGAQGVIVLDPRASVKTALHEAVHAATLSALHDPQTTSEREAAQYINELYQYTKQQLPGNTSYGLKSVEEFVAEAFSNPGFQAELAKIPLPGQSRYTLWDAFKAAIMKLLGVVKNNTILSETLLAGTELFSGRTTGIKQREYQDQGPPASSKPPSTAILGAKDNARTFIAYPKKNADDKWTLYPASAANMRGDPEGKVENLTRAQVEQYIQKAGSQVIPPASDTSVKSGTPKNTDKQQVGYGTDGNLQSIGFAQKDGTWTYYESDADVRTDPSARITKGVSKDAVQRFITNRGLVPTPPTPGAVKSGSDTPTNVGYKPVGEFRYTMIDVRAPIKAIGAGQTKLGHKPSENVGISATLRNSNTERELAEAKEKYVEPAAKAGRDIGIRFGRKQPEIEATLADLHIVERMQKKIDQTLRGKDDAATQGKRIQKYTNDMAAANARLDAARASSPAYVDAVKTEFAPKWKALTDNTTDLAAKYGLISLDVAQNMKNAYDFYVPLQVGEKTTTGKAATGMNTETDRSFQRIVEQLERTVNRGEDNRVVKGVGDVMRKFGVINDSNGQPVGVVGQGTKVRYDPETNSLNEEVDSHLFDPNTEFFYENGDRVPITISNDPVLLKALNPYKGQKRNALARALMATSAWLNRLTAVGKTSLNPAFMVGNVQRDIQAANINMPSGVSRLLFNAYLLDPRTISNVMTNVARELGGFKPTGQYAEARNAGAFISHRDFVGLAPLANDIDTYFRPTESWRGRNALRKKVQSKSFEALSAAAQVSESVPRFAMYKAAYDSYMKGKADTEANRREARLFAASAAKNASVNFEQRGAANLSSYWIFGNAKIQGLAALDQSIRRMGITKATIGLAGITALGYFIGEAQQDGDKDKDGKPKSTKVSDQVKDSKIFLNEGGWAATLNQEISPFYVFGHALSEYLRGNTNGAHTASRIATSVINNAWPGNVPQSEVAGYKSNPWNFAVQSMLPSGILPFQQVGQNENAFGSEIVPGLKNKLAQGIPKSDMGSPTENQLAVNLAQGMYKLTGGAVDVAPQQLRYINNYFNPLSETYAFIRDLAGLREPKYRGDIVNPITRKLTANATPFRDQDQFDELISKALRAEVRAEGRPAQGIKGVGIDALSPEEQVLARSHNMLAKVQSDIKGMFKGSQLLTKEKRDALNERARERMLEGIRRYNEARDRAGVR